jgi:cytochrome c2
MSRLWRFWQQSRDGVVLALIWTGAILAVLAARARPAMSLTADRLRETGRPRLFGPAALLIVAAILALTAIALYSGSMGIGRAQTLLTTAAFGDTGPAPGLMIRYGCAGCHIIPGVPGARGQVGPSLAGFSRRLYVGGAAVNTPDNLVRWLINPRDLSPHTAMPATGVDEAEARQIAAYLLNRK